MSARVVLDGTVAVAAAPGEAFELFTLVRVRPGARRGRGEAHAQGDSLHGVLLPAGTSPPGERGPARHARAGPRWLHVMDRRRGAL